MVPISSTTQYPPPAQGAPAIGLAARVGAAAALSRMGAALQKKGHPMQALGCCTRAVQLVPASAPLWFNLGHALLAQEQLEAAVDALRQAVRLAPDDARFQGGLAVALQARGLALKALGELTGAVACYREAVILAPGGAAVWSNLGNVLVALGRAAVTPGKAVRAAEPGRPVMASAVALLDEAVACHRRAVALQPGHATMRTNLASALNVLGAAFRVRGFPRRAEAAQRESVALDPTSAWTWTGLGNALRDKGDHDGAIAAHRRATSLDPAAPALAHNLGTALAKAGRHGEAVACFDGVLARDPGAHGVRWDRALSLLHLGRYEEGFLDYEARFAAGLLPARAVSGERWRGQPYAGKRLLLLSEQGFGDAIWTARYLPRVKALGGELVLEARPELVRLMQHQGWADEVVPKGAPLPGADYHLYICSLPGLFTRTASDISGEPYLTVPPGAGQAAVAAVRAAGGKRKVGIVWSGSVTFAANHERRTTLDEMLRALVQPGVQLFSLQKGPPEQELRRRPDAPVIDLAPMLGDFADTAAAVAELDLVVMTDSAVAHLAGALGRQVRPISSWAGYWLWNNNETRHTWYQSVCAFSEAHLTGFGQILGEVE